MTGGRNKPALRIELAILIALGVWAGWNWAHTLERVIHYYNPLPVADYWRIPQYFAAYRQLDWSVLWRQHNEHRIVLPEIVFAADALYFRALALLPLCVSFACYLGIWAILAASLRADRNLAPRARNMAILLCGAVLGWEGSAVVLAVPFLLSWTLVQLSGILAFAAIAWFRVSSRPIYLAIAIAVAAAATYSSANGLLLWPLLIATAALLRIRGRDVAILVISGAVAAGLFFVGYRFMGTFDAMQILRHPLHAAGFVLSFLGMPFGANRTRSFAICAGAINILSFAAVWIAAKSKRVAGTIPGTVLFGTFAFTLATALLTAAGRMNFESRDFIMAIQARYTTVPLVNWGALFAAAIWISARRGWRIVSPPRIAIISGVVLTIVFFGLGGWLHSMDNAFAKEQVATLSIENNLFDRTLVHTIFPNPGFVRHYLPALRENHLSIYDRDWPSRLGEPVSKFLRASGATVPGAILRTIPVQGGCETVGWTGKRGRVLMVNADGRLAGFGGRPRAGLPDDLQTAHPPSTHLWVAFVNEKFAVGPLRVYVWNGSRKSAVRLVN